MEDLVAYLKSKNLEGKYSLEFIPDGVFSCALNFVNGWTYLGRTWNEVLLSLMAEGI